MGFYGNLAKGMWTVGKASTRGSKRIGASLNDVMQARAGRSGILGPGDGPPPPGLVGDFLDYRGVASPSETAVLRDGEFPLGRTVAFSRRDRPYRLGAPFSAMARHALVLGPAGAGKTESVMIPWIFAALRGGHTVIATDVKGDLKDRLRVYAENRPDRPRARVRTWDTEAVAGQSLSWNWIGAIDTEQQLDAALVGLLGRQDQAHRPDLWNIDYEVSKGLVLYAKALFRRPITASDLRSCLDQDEIERNLAGNLRFPGYAELWPYVSLSPGDFTKATSGIRPVLAALSTASIERVTRAPELDIDEVLDSPGLFIIGARLSGGSITEKLTALALGLIQQRLNTRLSSRSHDRQVFIVIDEAGPLLERFDLPRALTTVRSGGVCYALGLQAVEMIDDENERKTILGNVAVTIAMRGMSEQTAEHLSKRFGQRSERVISDGRSGLHHDRSRQYSHVQLPVIAQRELQWPPFSDYAAVVSMTGDRRLPAKPIVVDLTRTDL